MQAVFGAYDNKWFRRNYLADAEKYGGVAYARLKAEAAKEEMHAKLEIANGIALEMEQRIEDLLTGEAQDLDLDPVHTFPRIDGISMKVRELSDCCPMHQCFGHLAVLGLKPPPAGKAPALSVRQHPRAWAGSPQAAGGAMAPTKKSGHQVRAQAGC